MNNLLKNRTKIIFRKLNKNTQNTFLVNGNSYLKCYQDSIKDRILKILEGLNINDRITIKEIIKRVKKDTEKIISIYNEINTLSKCGIVELKNSIITLKRKVQEVKKWTKKLKQF